MPVSYAIDPNAFTENIDRALAVLENGKLVGRIRLYDIQHLTSPTPVTAFYMMAYFLLGILATVAAVLIIVAF